MLDWQKDILKAAGLPADLNSIIGRQVRCDFKPAYPGDTEEQVVYTIMGVNFLSGPTGIDGGIQLVIEDAAEPVILGEAEALARPFLNHHRIWGWQFYRTTSYQDPDRPDEYTGWKERALRQVTWL